jgi:hypothetical protein
MREGSVTRRSGRTALVRRIVRPWTLIVVATGLFQVFRGAPVDGAFFLAIAALLVADDLGIVALPALRMPRMAVLVGVGFVLGVLLVLAPRHGIIEGVIVSGIGLSVLVYAWPDHGSGDSHGASLRRAGILWAVIAVAVCLIEVTSFLLGIPSEAAKFEHPSISLLLDPALDTIEGRIVFTALWVVVGIALLRRGRRT